MCQRVASGIAVLAVLMAMLSVVQSQSQSQSQSHSQSQEQPLWPAFVLDEPLSTLPQLAPDYVNGLLSLKESLLKPSDINRYATKSQPQQMQKEEQQQQQQQDADIAEFRPSKLSYQSLKKLMEMPAVVEAIAQQVPFITPSAKEEENVPQLTPLSVPQPNAEPEELRQQRTALTGDGQAPLLQQLQQFFGMRPKNQPEPSGLACTEAAPDASEDSNDCPTEPPDECEATEEPKEGEKVIVDVKPVKPKKNKAKGKATSSTTAKPKGKSTAKKLPCCTKKSKQASGLLPISFSLNFQNAQEPKEQQQKQPRHLRHVYRPDLEVEAYTNLLRYRREKAAHKELETSRKQRGVLDRQRLLEAQSKLWPIPIRNTMEPIY
ncbi:bromodomain-containing protein DDB_G0280777 [Drosophila guanche]|uniref:bromodomain-containing protein DDB_G0280777 n=1 Tax=Drosophila guanche TaxID=7266 RepID=UPI001472046F|nr:bromodomain-containing protein DDB_G0280777 [Drosophila guanche]